MLITSLTRGQHYCGPIHTWIPDPDAYAAALHHGIRHPTVQAALATPWRPGHLPCTVDIPIREILGPDGHQQCRGTMLSGPDLRAAQHHRDEWITRQELGLPLNGLRKPTAQRVPSFESGTVVFRFGSTHHDEAGYELVNMYPMPPLLEPGEVAHDQVGLIQPYWRTQPNAPFGTLLRTVDAHCHPESNRGGLDVLCHRFAALGMDDESEQLLAELDTVLNGRVSDLHPRALYTAAEYGEGSDEAFARALVDLLKQVAVSTT